MIDFLQTPIEIDRQFPAQLHQDRDYQYRNELGNRLHLELLLTQQQTALYLAWDLILLSEMSS